MDCVSVPISNLSSHPYTVQLDCVSLYVFLFHHYIYTLTVGLCVSVPISNLSSYSFLDCVSLYVFLFHHYIYTLTVGLCVSVPISNLSSYSFSTVGSCVCIFFYFIIIYTPLRLDCVSLYLFLIYHHTHIHTVQLDVCLCICFYFIITYTPLQLDCVSLYLLYLAQMITSGLEIIYRQDYRSYFIFVFNFIQIFY